MAETNDPGKTVSPERWAELERVVERFETAWRQGERPGLEDYLPNNLPQRREMLVELVHADLELRLKAGLPVRVEEYLSRYPELTEDREVALDLIAAEHELRWRRQEPLSLTEYRKRFPQYAGQLAERLQGRTQTHDQITLLAGGTLVQPAPALAPTDLPIDSAASLVERVNALEILSEDQRKELPSLLAAWKEPRPLAQELLRRGWLTPFQINRLFQGRSRELVLGPYRLLERLGAGGMGEVFKAYSVDMDQVVALKVVRPERLTFPEAVRRFRREIRAVIQLAHPHVVVALDTGQVEGKLFFSMEYVEGTDLGKLVRQLGPLPVRRACEYVRQAALGLQHAHERGLVHRDVKPSNLILRLEDSVVKVLDLGLARLLVPPENGEASTLLTREGMLVGTPDYMAPEQALNAHAADIRSDIFSLGCTLYHLLTGQVPFPGKNLTEKLLMIQVREPQPLEQLRPEVTPELTAVVNRMMAKRPADRYQVPAEVADALAKLPGRR